VAIPAAGPEFVTESGKPARNAECVKYLHMEGGAAVFEVGSGLYQFRSREPKETPAVSLNLANPEPEKRLVRGRRPNAGDSNIKATASRTTSISPRTCPTRRISLGSSSAPCSTTATSSPGFKLRRRQGSAEAQFQQSPGPLPNPTETCTTLAGTHDYEASQWVSGEGAIYSIPAGVTVKAVKYRETGYDTAFAGSFECNDEDSTSCGGKAARTAYLCMRDHFYDCPDRERVGFWVTALRNWISASTFRQGLPSTMQRSRPEKLEPGFYPGQHLEFLGEYGLWFYYLHTGDLASISAVYEATKAFLFDTYKFGNRTLGSIGAKTRKTPASSRLALSTSTWGRCERSRSKPATKPTCRPSTPT